METNGLQSFTLLSNQFMWKQSRLNAEIDRKGDLLKWANRVLRALGRQGVFFATGLTASPLGALYHGMQAIRSMNGQDGHLRAHLKAGVIDCIVAGVILKGAHSLVLGKNGRAIFVQREFVILSALISMLAWDPRRMADLLSVERKKTHSDKKQQVEVVADISGNPTHMGHMEMIALAVERLIGDGFQVSQVKIHLGNQNYVDNKVWEANLTKEPRAMNKVALPLETRIRFLNKVIEEAKSKWSILQKIQISYFENRALSNLPTYHVFGADYCLRDGVIDEEGLKRYSRAIIITRQGYNSDLIQEGDDGQSCRLIVNNPNPTMSYSSSSIQNGDYAKLPESIKDEFIKLHEEAQKNSNF